MKLCLSFLLKYYMSLYNNFATLYLNRKLQEENDRVKYLM